MMIEFLQSITIGIVILFGIFVLLGFLFLAYGITVMLIEDWKEEKEKRNG